MTITLVHVCQVLLRNKCLSGDSHMPDIAFTKLMKQVLAHLRFMPSIEALPWKVSVVSLLVSGAQEMELRAIQKTLEPLELQRYELN